MKKILLLALLATLLSFCSKNAKIAKIEAEMAQYAEDIKLNSPKRPKGIVPSDIGLNKLLDKEHYSWQDLDKYYRQTVLPKHNDKDYTSNLKNECITYLVDIFKMHEKADLATVEYYINEQASFPYLVSPERFMRCLNRMKGHWEEPRIAQLMETVRQKQIKTVQKEFASKPDVVKMKTDEYNQYLTYSKD